ncbi:MAG: squalene/phytoene synthase family protein [Pseudomonadota bacterium]
MAEAGLSPAADLVRRLDRPLFLAALFAPEPARERLMVLGAFDIELSRAAARGRGGGLGAEEGPLLARMRLQFWRDRLGAAERGEAPDALVAAHEVAGPFHDLMTGPLAPGIADAHAMISAREIELAAPLDRAGWEDWSEARFAACYRLSLAALGIAPAEASNQAADAAGLLAAAGFTLRHAAPMAREGVVLLPAADPETPGRLVRGEPNDAERTAIAALVADGEAARRKLSSLRRALGRRTAPAFLPLIRAERTIRGAKAGATLADLAADTDAVLAPPYTWRALTGRW